MSIINIVWTPLPEVRVVESETSYIILEWVNPSSVTGTMMPVTRVKLNTTSSMSPDEFLTGVGVPDFVELIDTIYEGA